MAVYVDSEDRVLRVMSCTVIGPKGDKGDTGAKGDPGLTVSVNGNEPDAGGNVSVTAADVPYQKTVGTTETHDVAEALDALADTLDGVEDLLAAI